MKKKSIFGLILLVSLFVNTLVFSSPILASAPQKDVPNLEGWAVTDTYGWDMTNQSWATWAEGNVSSIVSGALEMRWNGIDSDRARMEESGMAIDPLLYNYFAIEIKWAEGADVSNCYISIRLHNESWVTLVSVDFDEGDTYRVGLGNWTWGAQNITTTRITVIGDSDDVAVIEYMQYESSEWSGWHEAQELDMLLLTEAYQGMFNAWIVFLGLCLIPLAMIFLALKYKSGDLDGDTLLVGLIFLVIGWALFFGGLI